MQLSMSPVPHLNAIVYEPRPASCSLLLSITILEGRPWSLELIDTKGYEPRAASSSSVRVKLGASETSIRRTFDVNGCIFDVDGRI